MGIYSHLSDQELADKRAELLAKYEALTGGGGVSKMSGEGRSMELTRGDAGGIKKLLNSCIDEINERGGTGLGGAAIGVDFT